MPLNPPRFRLINFVIFRSFHTETGARSKHNPWRRIPPENKRLWRRLSSMTGDIIEAAKFVGAGLSMIGALGAGIGIGLSVQGALEGMARNPDTYGTLLTNMILGIAFSEAIAIYCLVIAFLMLFVL